MPDRISQQEFIRKLLTKKGQISWLLGAGTSVSANMPTAQVIISDLKKKYYCSEENQSFQGNDIQNVPVREKIQSYSDSKGYPAEWDDEEYSFYFQLLFGEDYTQQRNYLLGALNTEKIAVSVGQRVLAGLIAMEYISCIFSTNFDEVVEKSYSKVTGNNITPFHIEGAYAALDALNNNDFPLYVKLHGDFRYTSIKNLEQDLLDANENLGKCFLQAGSRFGFFVVGYSGRDRSVMKLLDNILENNNPFPHGLYWAVLKNSNTHTAVISLIDKAQSKGVDAYIIEIDDYVALMSSIWKQIPSKMPELESAVSANRLTKVNIPLPSPGNNDPLIRFNTLPIQKLPHEIYKIDPVKKLDWKEYSDIRYKFRGRIISFEDEGIFAWGSLLHIKEAFGNSADISKCDISDKLKNLTNHKALKGALEEALCRAIVNEVGLNYKAKGHNKFLTLPIPSERNKSLNIDKFSFLKGVFGIFSGVIPNIQSNVIDKETGEEKKVPVSWSESVQVTIAEMSENYIVAFRPDIWVSPKRERKQAKEFIVNRVSGNWETTRKNDVLDKIISAWLDTITGSANENSLTLVAYPEAEQAGKAEFQLITKSSYSKRG